jgi:GAF domain-containing protein
MRRRGGTDAAAFCDPDFLAVADLPTVHRAILDAAVTVAGAASADLQLYDRAAGVLRIAAHHGFHPRFLTFFATVAAGQPTACATALATRQPVLVDDVTRSPIFAGQSTLEAMLDAGSRAVYSYPLIARGDIIGVLSVHHRKSTAHHGTAGLVADSAAWALWHIDAR